MRRLLITVGCCLWLLWLRFEPAGRARVPRPPAYVEAFASKQACLTAAQALSGTMAREGPWAWYIFPLCLPEGMEP